jgi:NADPH2:quinone reductase
LGRAHDVFTAIQARHLTIRIDRKLPLAEAATSHMALEGRETSGKLLLIP